MAKARQRDIIYERIFNPSQRQLYDRVNKFSRAVVAPHLSDMDSKERIPDEIIDELRNKHVFGMGLPEKYGGDGNGLIGACIRDEALGYGSASVALLVGVSSGLTANTILNLGTDAQKRHWIPKLAAGRIGTFQLTEAGAGSDSKGIRTSITFSKGHALVNGEKIFVTNGKLAEMGVVFARTPHRNDPTKFSHSAIIVPNVSAYLAKAAEDKMGLRASHTSVFAYQDTRLPEEFVLGEKKGRGKGFEGAKVPLERARVTLSAIALGMAKRAYDEAILHYEKHVRDAPMHSHEKEAIRGHLAKMHGIIDNMRRHVYTVAAEYPKSDFSIAAATTKEIVTEGLNQVADLALRVGGQKVAMDDSHPITVIWRDARVFKIFEGTNEIQRIIVASHITPRGRKEGAG